MSNPEIPQEPEIPKGPEINASLTNGVEVNLTWHNTILNTFDDDRYNFIQIVVPDGSNIISFPNKDLVELMLEHRYPNYHRPYVPLETKAMIEGYWLREMQESLGEILGG